MTIRHGLRSVVCAAVLGLSLPVSAQPSDDYALNRDASTVGFTVYARMLFTVPNEGRFTQFSGQLSYDPASPDNTRVDLTVYTASVDMDNAEHAQLLRSDAFFDVSHFPTMHFVSAGVQLRPDGSVALTGDLTIRDVTKRIGIPVTIRPVQQSSVKGAIFETTFDIDRTEFGLNGSPKTAGFNVPISKKVQIHIAISGIAKPPSR